MIWLCEIVTNFVICVKLDVGMIWGVVARLLKLRARSMAKRGGSIIIQFPQKHYLVVHGRFRSG